MLSCIMLVISVDALLGKLTVVTALSGHSRLSIEAGEFEHVQGQHALTTLIKGQGG